MSARTRASALLLGLVRWSPRAVTAIAAVMVAVKRRPQRRPTEPEPVAVACWYRRRPDRRGGTGVPTRAGMMAIDPPLGENAGPPAHAENMRYLRAYPGRRRASRMS